MASKGSGYSLWVLAYGQAIANLVQFQSWQMVIRFGARHLAEKRSDRLRALLQFGSWLDFASGLISAILGTLLVPLAAGWLGWPHDIAEMAQLFCLSLLIWPRATPVGVLRLLDRFALMTWAEAITPVVRFAGAFIASAVAPTIGAFLTVWALSEVLASLVLWLMAARCLRCHAVSLGPGSARGVVASNPGLWRFAWASNAIATVNLVWQQLGTLVIGGATGAAAAGGYRLAFQFAQALSRPALLLGRVIYPEFSRLGEGRPFMRALRGATLAAAASGALVVAVTDVFGDVALRMVAGDEFADAASLLTILVLATALDLAGFAFEPALMAMGRAGQALMIRSAGALAYVAVLLLLLDRWGAHGVAWAAVCGSLIVFGMSLALLRGLSRDRLR